LKTYKNKAPKAVRNLRKTHKKHENSLSKKHTQIRLFQKTKKQKTDHPASRKTVNFRPWGGIKGGVNPSLRLYILERKKKYSKPRSHRLVELLD